MLTPMESPPLLFYAYADPDERFAEELEKHLSSMEHEGLIRSWNARMIKAGEDRGKEIGRKLNEAGYILFLVSADFLADCTELIQLALQHHKAKRAKIIPVLVRAVDWKRSPFGALEPCPRNGKSVKSWADQDEAWLDVVESIRGLLDKDGAAGPSPPPEPPPPRRPAAAAYDRNELLDALCKLLPAQFEQVLFRLNIQPAQLSTDAPRAKCAVEIIRLLEQEDGAQGLVRLASIIKKVAPALSLG